MKGICAFILIMCLTLSGFIGQAEAQEGDSVAEGVMATWSSHESTAVSAADGVRATAAAYGRCVAENWYRQSSGQRQACDVRPLFASDTTSQAEAQYLYDLNTYWLQWSEAPAADVSISAVSNPVVTNIQIASNGQTATASVAAVWTKQERSSTAAKNQDTTDNNTVCDLTLHYENGKWLITHEDCSSDNIRRDQYLPGTDFTKLMQAVPAEKAAYDEHEKEAEAAWQEQVQHMRDTGDPRYAFLSDSDRQLAPLSSGGSTANTVPLTSTYTSYSGAKALSYSNTYWYPYNTLFYNFNSSGGDCQNFGSQCVWYGFGGINSAPTINTHVMPMISNSVSPAIAWWGDASSTATSSWTSGTAFENMVRSNLTNNAYGVQASCGSNNDDGGAPVTSIAVGDIVRVHDYTHNVFHTMVVVRANGTYNGIYVSSHNANFQKSNLALMYVQNLVDLDHIVVFCNPPGA